MNRDAFVARVFLLAVALGLIQTETGGAQDLVVKPHAPLVVLDAFADTSSVSPGGNLTIAARLRVAPGWHVYWKHPGDTGLPTRVTVTSLPKGAKVDKARWPLPKRFEEPGGLISFGYESEVVVLIPLTLPATIAKSKQVGLRVEASWLVCKTRCVAGKGAFDLRLPVSASKPSAPAHQALFADWRRRLPVPLAELSKTSEKAAMVQVRQAPARPSGDSGSVKLTLTWSREPAKVEWFPGASAAVGVDEIRVAPRGKSTLIEFQYKVYLPKEIPTGVMESVVAFVDGEGRRRGIEVPVRIAQPRSG